MRFENKDDIFYKLLGNYHQFLLNFLSEAKPQKKDVNVLDSFREK